MGELKDLREQSETLVNRAKELIWPAWVLTRRLKKALKSC